jgi:hypothetical protein
VLLLFADKDFLNIPKVLNHKNSSDINFISQAQNFATFVITQYCILCYPAHTLAKLWAAAILLKNLDSLFFSGLHSFYEIWRI